MRMLRRSTSTCAPWSRALVFQARILCTLLIGAAAVGCGSRAGTSSATRPTAASSQQPQAVVSNTDACASQMHDLCGAFLGYLLTHPTLPPSLDELDRRFLPQGEESFFCPLSRQAYIYRPNGIILPEKNARIILYDASPSHSGFRMAIRAEEPEDGRAPVMKVVALPESFFLLRPPGSESPVPARQ